jgi:hypothetical protein
MKPDPLEQTLASYARQPLPPCPEQLTAEVWRDIERRRHKSIWSRHFPLLDWHELFGEPRLTVVALGFAVMIGVVPAVMFSRTENVKRLARQSMHFEVFSANSLTQFVTLPAEPAASALRP